MAGISIYIYIYINDLLLYLGSRLPGAKNHNFMQKVQIIIVSKTPYVDIDMLCCWPIKATKAKTNKAIISKQGEIVRVIIFKKE